MSKSATIQLVVAAEDEEGMDMTITVKDCNPSLETLKEGLKTFFVRWSTNFNPPFRTEISVHETPPCPNGSQLSDPG